MSTKSGSPQYASVRNCWIALCSIGPRQITGWSSGTKYPMERHLTPWAEVGITMSPMMTGSWSVPSILGTEKP